ncbi:MAG: hypothetical protein JRN12_03545 [Nitrososphaerota archaeon]|jgi:hypothetical protein|nr:hypothetical protein [Nitrososphaerota archaeon]MDG6950904.1 hypothetical protein [Nitrososphaerota archaeon]
MEKVIISGKAIREANPPPQESRFEYSHTTIEAGAVVVTPVPKLEAESSLDTVGTVGGLRVYIPARMTKDSQFPFNAGQIVAIKGVKNQRGSVIGLLITDKKAESSTEG